MPNSQSSSLSDRMERIRRNVLARRLDELSLPSALAHRAVVFKLLDWWFIDTSTAEAFCKFMDHPERALDESVVGRVREAFSRMEEGGSSGYENEGTSS